MYFISFRIIFRNKVENSENIIDCTIYTTREYRKVRLGQKTFFYCVVLLVLVANDRNQFTHKCFSSE